MRSTSVINNILGIQKGSMKSTLVKRPAKKSKEKIKPKEYYIDSDSGFAIPSGDESYYVNKILTPYTNWYSHQAVDPFSNMYSTLRGEALKDAIKNNLVIKKFALKSRHIYVNKLTGNQVKQNEQGNFIENSQIVLAVNVISISHHLHLTKQKEFRAILNDPNNELSYKEALHHVYGNMTDQPQRPRHLFSEAPAPTTSSPNRDEQLELATPSIEKLFELADTARKLP